MDEPQSAPWWYPSNDHPRDKSTFDVSIAVPPGVEALSNGVLVDTDAADEMERVYRGFAEDAPAYADAVYDGKRAIMRAALASPLAMLATELLRIAHADRHTRDYTLNNLRDALAEVVESRSSVLVGQVHF